MKHCCFLVFLLSVLLGGPAWAGDDSAANLADEPVAAERVDEAAATQTVASPFGVPVFVEAPGVCLGSDAPVPAPAAGFGCPYGPTCYGDAQCVNACKQGTGACAPDFCCWCFAS